MRTREEMLTEANQLITTLEEFKDNVPASKLSKDLKIGLAVIEKQDLPGKDAGEDIIYLLSNQLGRYLNNFSNDKDAKLTNLVREKWLALQNLCLKIRFERYKSSDLKEVKDQIRQENIIQNIINQTLIELEKVKDSSLEEFQRDFLKEFQRDFKELNQIFVDLKRYKNLIRFFDPILDQVSKNIPDLSMRDDKELKVATASFYGDLESRICQVLHSKNQSTEAVCAIISAYLNLVSSPVELFPTELDEKRRNWALPASHTIFPAPLVKSFNTDVVSDKRKFLTLFGNYMLCVIKFLAFQNNVIDSENNIFCILRSRLDLAANIDKTGIVNGTIAILDSPLQKDQLTQEICRLTGIILIDLNKTFCVSNFRHIFMARKNIYPVSHERMISEIANVTRIIPDVVKIIIDYFVKEVDKSFTNLVEQQLAKKGQYPCSELEMKQVIAQRTIFPTPLIDIIINQFLKLQFNIPVASRSPAMTWVLGLPEKKPEPEEPETSLVPKKSSCRLM
jgi:hypothetical protein